MRDIDITTLRMFATVCETGSMAKAGVIHNMVPSAVSKRIALLEADVGVELIERRREGNLPTAAGEALMAHARTILLQSERARRDMDAFRQGVRARIRVLASVSCVAESLPGDIAAFLNDPANELIQVDIEETLSSDMCAAITNGAAPLGICWDATDLGLLESRPYRLDHLAVVMHPGHPLADRERCEFAETLEWEHVGLPPGTAGYRLLAKAAAGVGRAIRYRMLLSTFDAALKMVGAGLGVAVMPIEIAGLPASAMGLRLVPLTDPWAARRFVVCYRHERSLSPAAKLLLDFLARTAETGAEEPGGSGSVSHVFAV